MEPHQSIAGKAQDRCFRSNHYNRILWIWICILAAIESDSAQKALDAPTVSHPTSAKYEYTLQKNVELEEKVHHFPCQKIFLQGR
jgi:hypothetical protein